MSSRTICLGISAVTLLACAAGASAGTKYYLRSQVGDAWGMPGNEQAMDLAFGNGNYNIDAYETANLGTVFSGGTDFVLVDGGDGNINSFKTFVEGNHNTLENWVAAGGCLYLNAAGWYGVSVDTGFNGTSINGGFYDSVFTVLNPTGPIANGPNQPAGTNYTGNYASHASITGGTALGVGGGGQTTLAEFNWGGGHVILGGLTDLNWWGQVPNSLNMRANLLLSCQVPAPGAAALLGLAGLAAARRRR